MCMCKSSLKIITNKGIYRNIGKCKKIVQLQTHHPSLCQWARCYLCPFFVCDDATASFDHCNTHCADTSPWGFHLCHQGYLGPNPRFRASKEGSRGFHNYTFHIFTLLTEGSLGEGGSMWKHFHPGEGSSRGLLRDCEIFANLRLKLCLVSPSPRTPSKSTPTIVQVIESSPEGSIAPLPVCSVCCVHTKFTPAPLWQRRMDDLN